MTNPTPARHRRRWWKALAGVLILPALGVAALPWLVGSKPGRSRVLAGINRALAPGRLEFVSLGVSWSGPTRVGDFALFDPGGVKVASGRSATLDRTLGQWILGAPGTLTMTLDGARLDVERSPDGSINLADALRSVIAHPNPKRDFAVKIAGGSLSYRDPFLSEPSTSDDLDLDLRVRPAPDPVTWKLRLARSGASLDVHGDFDQWLSRGGPPQKPELQVSIASKAWPIVARTAGLDASARLDGTIDFLRRQGLWKLSGDAKLAGFEARGAPLKGDTLAFNHLDAGWDVSEGEQGWTIRRLGLTSPVGELKVEGDVTGVSGLGKQRIEGRVDLAAIARQLPHALRLREGLAVDRGTARLTVDVESVGDHAAIEVEGRVADLAARDGGRTLGLRDPATFSARFLRDGQASSLERFAVKSSFLDASARGRLVDGVALEATLSLDKLRDQLAEWVDLGGVELSGAAKMTGNYRLQPAGTPGAGFRFEHSLATSFRDLKVEGFAPLAMLGQRNSASWEVEGPAEASGWPTGWDRADLRAGPVGTQGTWARLQLKPKGGAIGVTAYLHDGLITKSYPDQYAAASLDGEWSPAGRVLAIDRVEANVFRPVDKRPNRYVEAVARGRLDLSSGELTLDAPPDTPSTAIAPGADGVRVSGLGRGLANLRAEGSLSGGASELDDLLSDLMGRAPLGLSGRWSAIANARGDAEGVQLAGHLGLDDSNASGKAPRPTALTFRGHYATAGDRVDLSEFTVSTAYGTLDASGRIEDPRGRRLVDLKGTLAPDFQVINALLSERVEPGATVEGRPRAFRASGTLGSADRRFEGLDAEVGFDLTGADIYGMKFGPSPVVLRSRAGHLTFDPISTTLNEGHVRLEPEIDLDGLDGPVLRLGKNSTIREARINDEVSRRVLAYVAPILDRATRASGLVSVDLDHAEFPIGPGRRRQAKVEGAVVFENVEFAPGPLANDLLSAVGRRDVSLKLDRPVNLTIADGRVNQRGLALPIGDLTRIELEGWVDFDRNLAITATLPVTPAMLGNNAILSDIAAGTRVQLPITGTLDKPVINRDAMGAGMRDLTRSLITRGALDLLMKMGQPKDPNAPPPPPRLTPQERKALRQEKKAIRRGEMPPPPAEGPAP